ncbi:collagen alpha-1(I) chain-like [Felis catus]|uniref:collagen alpha-1(I) chain-like n=1 Tax=Felis catus TaxID=9685 RepID=UPI001D19A8F6|nr:collagen alpha-1(I) chain-like [Felis catus]
MASRGQVGGAGEEPCRRGPARQDPSPQRHVCGLLVVHVASPTPITGPGRPPPVCLSRLPPEGPNSGAPAFQQEEEGGGPAGSPGSRAGPGWAGPARDSSQPRSLGLAGGQGPPEPWGGGGVWLPLSLPQPHEGAVALHSPPRGALRPKPRTGFSGASCATWCCDPGPGCWSLLHAQRPFRSGRPGRTPGCGRPPTVQRRGAAATGRVERETSRRAREETNGHLKGQERGQERDHETAERDTADTGSSSPGNLRSYRLEDPENNVGGSLGNWPGQGSPRKEGEPRICVCAPLISLLRTECAPSLAHREGADLSVLANKPYPFLRGSWHL